jgi:hypothetical protein
VPTLNVPISDTRPVTDDQASSAIAAGKVCRHEGHPSVCLDKPPGRLTNCLTMTRRQVHQAGRSTYAS